MGRSLLVHFLRLSREPNQTQGDLWHVSSHFDIYDADAEQPSKLRPAFGLMPCSSSGRQAIAMVS